MTIISSTLNIKKLVTPIKLVDLLTTILAINILFGKRNSYLRRKIKEISKEDYINICKSLKQISKKEVLQFKKLSKTEKIEMNQWAKDIIKTKKLHDNIYYIPKGLLKIKSQLFENPKIIKNKSFLYRLCEKIFEFDYIYGNEKISKSYFEVNQITLNVLTYDGKQSEKKQDIIKRLNESLKVSKSSNYNNNEAIENIATITPTDFLATEFNTSNLVNDILDNSLAVMDEDKKEQVIDIYEQGTNVLIEQGKFKVVKNNLYLAISRKNLEIIQAIKKSCENHSIKLWEIFTTGELNQIYIMCKKIKTTIHTVSNKTLAKIKEFFENFYKEIATFMSFSSILSLINHEAEEENEPD